LISGEKVGPGGGEPYGAGANVPGDTEIWMAAIFFNCFSGEVLVVGAADGCVDDADELGNGKCDDAVGISVVDCSEVVENVAGEVLFVAAAAGCVDDADELGNGKGDDAVDISVVDCSEVVENIAGEVSVVEAADGCDGVADEFGKGRDEDAVGINVVVCSRAVENAAGDCGPGRMRAQRATARHSNPVHHTRQPLESHSWYCKC